MADEIGYATSNAPLIGWQQLLVDDQEENPELQWPDSVKVYDKMRTDAQVSSILEAVSLPIMSTPWRIEPNGARDEVVDHVATDLGLPVRGRADEATPRTRDRFSWTEHLRLALLMLPFGNSFFEQVYRIDGGRARLRKLAWRPPRTISAIEVARDGGLVAIEQGGWAGQGQVRIPVDRLVAYVNRREGAQWQGRSTLRPAYKPWLLKDRALRVQSVTLERNGLGVPIYEAAPVPDNANAAERDAWIASERANGLELAKGLRSGQTAGASTPHGAKLSMKGVEGRLPDADVPIRYYDEQIARAVLAHFLNLGTETGSWALGSTFADFFTGSLNGTANHVRSITQQHVIEDLVDLNFGQQEPAPQLVFDPIGSTLTAEAIRALVDCGAITPDAGIEDYLRASYGLPARKEQGGSEPEAGGDAEAADRAATVAQKVYLAVHEDVIDRDEARDLVRQAGANLKETA